MEAQAKQDWQADSKHSHSAASQNYTSHTAKAATTEDPEGLNNMDTQAYEFSIFLNSNDVLIDTRVPYLETRIVEPYKQGSLSFAVDISDPYLVALGSVQAVLNELEKSKIRGAKLNFCSPLSEIVDTLNTGKCPDPRFEEIWQTLSRKIEAAGHSVKALEVTQAEMDTMTQGRPKKANPEIWKVIEGTNGLYEISSHGRVYSHHTKGRKKKEGFLKPRFMWKERRKDGSKRGYYIVDLSVSGRVIHNRRIDHLVLEAFHGPRPEGCESCHYDDDPANNHAGNLYWGTRSSNRLDGKFNNPRAGCIVTRPDLDLQAQAEYRDRIIGATCLSAPL